MHDINKTESEYGQYKRKLHIYGSSGRSCAHVSYGDINLSPTYKTCHANYINFRLSFIFEKRFSEPVAMHQLALISKKLVI